MKKRILSIALAVCLALGSLIIIPMSVSAWNWKDDGHFEVAEHKATIVPAGSITVDARLDDLYIGVGGTKIVNYPDASPYRRSPYNSVFDLGRGEFIAYIAADTKGLYVYAEIEDKTIFKTTNDDGNDGDCFQIYLDWCPSGVLHPTAAEMYAKYQKGSPWDYASYKNTYAKSGNQYLGWLSGDYNGKYGGWAGFGSLNSMGPNKNESVVYKTRFTESGWACEWFIPWRDQTQKNAVANRQQFHIGIGFQANDDCDINDTVTPGVEQNVAITFDQRREIGLSYWSDYSMLSDVVFTSVCDHDWSVSDREEKTCDAFGYTAYVCSKCNGDKTVTEPASHGERIEYICSEAGKKDVICADCGELLSEGLTASGAADSHVYEKQEGSVDATCTDGGNHILKCKYCDSSTEMTLKASGHKCTYSNKLDKYLCLDCAAEIVSGDVDGDGSITNADVLAIYRYIYDPEAYPLATADIADVDRNGSITNADVLKIYRNIYNSETYPIEREKAEFQLNGISISEYKIIYPDGEDVMEEYAYKLRDEVKRITGAELKVLDDIQPYRRGSEILVGYSSSRLAGKANGLEASVSALKNGEYLAFSKDSFLYLGGCEGDCGAVAQAVNKLIALLSAADEGYAEINVSEKTAVSGTKYKVITYNDGDNSTTNTTQVSAILNEYSPDIIGFQEVQEAHLSVYNSKLGYKYSYVYFDNDGTTYNSQPIYYKKDKFTLVDSGIKWLSDTPDVRSKFDESDYIRSFTYARLKDKTTGEEIVVINTHIDYVSAVNEKQIAKMLELTKQYWDLPVFYMADYNMNNSSTGYAKMRDAGFLDCGSALGVNVAGHIDFCFVDIDTATPVAFKYIDDHQYSSTASDHKPVYAEIVINAK